MNHIHRRDVLRSLAVGSVAAALPPVLLPARSAAAAKPAFDGERLRLENDHIALSWRRSSDQWRLDQVRVRTPQGWAQLPNPLGEYRVLSSLQAEPPARDAVAREAAGDSTTLFPTTARQDGDGISFSATSDAGVLDAVWTLDPKHPNDVQIALTFTPADTGWHSVATPTLVSVDESDLAWGTVPGCWAGSDIQPDLGLATKYGQGLPAVPHVAFDHVATTMTSIIETRGGVSVAVTAEPGQSRDPYQADAVTTRDVRVALSTRDRTGRLTPQMYRPVLGGSESKVETGQSLAFTVRVTLAPQGWWDVYNHVVNDVYKFPEFLELKQSSESLTSRMARIQATYVDDPELSQWVTDEYNGATIGAQRYNGFVKEADGDAMKNSDIGAMWAFAAATDDPIIVNDRLPYVRDFKLAQQQVEPGHYRGANLGQYYLYKTDRFVEEGQRSGNIPNYVEPLAITYYTIIDMAHILLFQPDDEQLRSRLRLAADKLMEIQHADGSWDVATNREAPFELTFPHLRDLRPTWYGLLVAHRMLGDQRYLDAALRGAEWYLRNAVKKGHYIGSTGDSVFEMDLSVSQGIQGLLDLADTTGKTKYRKAAIDVARIYAGAVYTHPIPDRKTKKLPNGKVVEDWQLSQVGLQKEHSGSASVLGPILLNSHVATFVRVHELTGDQIFLDMARAAAIGREAFVNAGTGVTSYYWASFDNGIGAFPHHSWWQLGWMLDYLMSELHLRSDGKIRFPRGFFTPKVGGQQTYGFAPGEVHGRKATLRIPPGLLRADKPQVETLGALNTNGGSLLVLILNQTSGATSATVQVDANKIRSGGPRQITRIEAVHGTVNDPDPASGRFGVELGGWGLAVIEVHHR